jgi:16S rRNA (guanine527-N7)-methyltransferase
VSGDLSSRIAARASTAGAAVDETLARRLAAYTELLARWNRTINLTALKIDPPDDEAIDRLLIESIVAAKYVNADEHFVIDVGSGGGSPALPLKLALPRLRFVLVESKARKAAFLREAVRHLELADVVVEHQRIETLAEHMPRADLVMMRAVRIDAPMARAIAQLLATNGRAFLFGSTETPERDCFSATDVHPLVDERRSSLRIGRPLLV